MTNPTTPAGWYQDPTEPAGSRWWDGIQWTDHYQQPYDPAAPVTSPSAPAGTRAHTPWIWLIVFLPYLTLPLFFAVDFGSMVDGLTANDPGYANRAQFELLTSPVYIVSVLAGWVTYGLCVLFAFLDHKELMTRAVPRPFHWAWTFLWSPAYVIGRSVIVRRRTGRGIAPMWAAIGMLAVSMVVSIVLLVVVFSALFQEIERSTTF